MGPAGLEPATFAIFSVSLKARNGFAVTCVKATS